VKAIPQIAVALGGLFLALPHLCADIVASDTFHQLDSANANYAGGQSPLTGGALMSSVAIGASSGQLNSGTSVSCGDCTFSFTSGPFTGNSMLQWDFATPGSVTFTGSVDLDRDGGGIHGGDPDGYADPPDLPLGSLLFSGSLNSVTIARCDLFDPGEVCLFGTFSGPMNPELDITGGYFRFLLGFPCGPTCTLQDGLLPPAAFNLSGLAVGGSSIEFTTAVPEPSALFLLGGVLVAIAISRAKFAGSPRAGTTRRTDWLR
jgi:hypothetical protein